MKLLTICAITLLSLATLATGAYESKRTGPLLRSFDGFKYDVVREADGIYRFHFHTGDSSRTEERDSSGTVKGEYAFVAPEGNEYEFKYEADKEGYRVESDALPEQPEDTDAVKEARENFLQEYEKALERAKESSYEYEEYDVSDESSEESSEEDSEEDDDRYSLFAYGFGNGVDEDESSEESSEEDSDSDEEEEEEEETFSHVGQRVEEIVNPNSAAYSHFGLRSAPLPYNRNRL